jgi:hypothetical protein
VTLGAGGGQIIDRSYCHWRLGSSIPFLHRAGSSSTSG